MHQRPRLELESLTAMLLVKLYNKIRVLLAVLCSLFLNTSQQIMEEDKVLLQSSVEFWASSTRLLGRIRLGLF
jgi:hypothetical protein